MAEPPGEPDSAAFEDAHLIERPLGSKTLLGGGFLTVKQELVVLPDGRHATRDYVVHPGAVMVVPILDGERLVMERQFRYPVGRVLLEFPAGKLEPGESPLACARRELAEETGFRADEWAVAGHMFNAPAYADEVIWVLFARGLRHGVRRLEAGEFLDVVIVRLDELERHSASGALPDAKTVFGLHRLMQWRRGAWQPNWASGPDADAALAFPSVDAAPRIGEPVL